MNAISRIGKTCASVVLGGVLMAGAMFAATPAPISVTLPHAVTVGSTTLPSGQYTITRVPMSDGNEYFVVRGQNTPAVTLQAQRIYMDDGNETRLVFSKDGDTWHFDKLYMGNDQSGYEFRQ
ncbi:MAG: hypothetical protein KGN84_00805 [Acidobacteriota bacterium]|nr:hypothetical protein [Acidobacteriota bacterium]